MIKRKPIKLGFIPLTDCAPVVMARELGLYEKHGLVVDVSRELSWAAVRDKILCGELHGSHCLFGMPFSVYTGVGGRAGSEMLVAMVLSNNGQGITLRKDGFAGKVGFKEIDRVRAGIDALKKEKETVIFAMTFPGGTHDIWLRYWLAAAGVEPNSVKIITIPPPQMVQNMMAGNMDGYCVGEPWGGLAVQRNLGITHISSQDIWRHHPEKALVVNKGFAAERRDELKALISALLEASRWLDDFGNRTDAAVHIAKRAFVDAPPETVQARLLGTYDLGSGKRHNYVEDPMLFHRGGEANFPRRAHAIWFMAQYRRFGLLNRPPDYHAVAEKLILSEVYIEAAQSMNVPIPADDLEPFAIDLDGAVFDPASPEAGLLARPAA